MADLAEDVVDALPPREVLVASLGDAADLAHEAVDHLQPVGLVEREVSPTALAADSPMVIGSVVVGNLSDRRDSRSTGLNGAMGFAQ